MNKLEVLKRVIGSGRIYLSQAEAAILLDLTQGHISNLMKAGKIKATNAYQPKPYLESVLDYKPNPRKKRHNRRRQKGWANQEQDLFREKAF